MSLQNQDDSTQNQEIQGAPQMQQQVPLIPSNQIQGVPQLQQQVQGIPSNQIQGVPQLQQQVQGYNTNMNNNFYPMQQEQTYSGQGTNGRGSGFRLIKFAEKDENKNLETVSENKENESKKESKLELAAVIVTICDGSTYDSLFSSVKQDAGEGSRVAVYACSKANIKDLMHAIKSKGDINMSDRQDDLQLLLADLNEIEDESCVAINYECCSECSDTGFHGMSSQEIMQELQFFLQEGYLIMYSDFSLKAFIKAWTDIGAKTGLGPNPLVRTQDFTGSVIVNFNPYTLKTCISSQLQSVGELCPDQDYCTVHCMGGTVRYSIKKKFQKGWDKLPYDIEILTVTKFNSHKDSCSIQVPDFSKLNKDKKSGDKKKEKRDSGFWSMFGLGQKKDEKKKDENDKELEKDIDVTKLPMKTLCGDAGHIVLDFSKNMKGDGDKGKKSEVLYGKVLLSMTHWCELVKLGDSVNDDVLFKVAAKNMGTSSKAYQNMMDTYESYGGKNASGQQKMQQKAWVSQTANIMVQQQAPCNNTMNSNISYSKKSKGSGYY